jgi:transposase-like protein
VNVSALARHLGISPPQLFDWRKAFLKKQEADITAGTPIPTQTLGHIANQWPSAEIDALMELRALNGLSSPLTRKIDGRPKGRSIVNMLIRARLRAEEPLISRAC